MRKNIFYTVMPRFGTNRQGIFELGKNKIIGRSLEFFAKQKIGMTVLMIYILVSSPSIAKAECTPTPNCASIGYTETSCEGKFVRCPFDTSKLFCVPCDSAYQYTCNGEGYSGGEGKSCNNKYISCECSANYEWNGSACIANCPSGYSTDITSCRNGYTFATGGYSGNKACGICFSNSTGCPDGYVNADTFLSDYGIKYSNNSASYIYTMDKKTWCIPQSSIYENTSVSALAVDSTDLVTNTGTITVSNDPVLKVRLYGELTVHGDVSVISHYLLSSSAKITYTGRVKVWEAIYLTTGAKFCAKNIDLSMVAYGTPEVRDYWCMKDWGGWHGAPDGGMDRTGSGPCDFDGECYY